MRLPSAELSLEEKLAEFDIWITPSLGEITETDQFKNQLARIVNIFEIINIQDCDLSHNKGCEPESISELFIREISRREVLEERITILKSLASTLFLVTGKTDNNFKCQFPLYLRDIVNWNSIYKIKKLNNKSVISQDRVPREIKSYDFMKTVELLSHEHQDIAKHYLKTFVSFLLNTENSISQLKSINHCYKMLKEFRKEKDLITPLVIFQIKGSVTASEGHNPEDNLRKMLDGWGLRYDIDFNIRDINVCKKTKTNEKTRSFDFVLPYKTEEWADEWKNRFFIQCQFYAGDSGSVSHKNIDQTSSSRINVIKENKDAKFIEFVDGAGYFSSLNRDLRSLLAMSTTRSFFQIRSAPVRLRRALQEIGFLTPLEIEHAIIRTTGEQESVEKCLKQEGYQKKEITRALGLALSQGFIVRYDNILKIRDDRHDLVRRYFLLDIIALYGKKLDDSSHRGMVVIPGYGPFYGLRLSALPVKASGLTVTLRDEISSSQIFSADIEWLSSQGYVIS